jgi:hypothetical protein
MSGNLSKGRLVNLATPDANIIKLKSTDPQLYNAMKNMGDAHKQVINAVFPPPPTPNYRGRIIIPGPFQTIPKLDVLSHSYHVVLPTDPSGYWTFNAISITQCYVTIKVAPVSIPLSVDILMSQQKGTTPFKSLFQPGFNPQIPIGALTTHNVKFAISNLYQDDIGRVDVLTGDSTASNIEIVLIGSYTMEEKTIT